MDVFSHYKKQSLKNVFSLLRSETVKSMKNNCYTVGISYLYNSYSQIYHEKKNINLTKEH